MKRIECVATPDQLALIGMITIGLDYNKYNESSVNKTFQSHYGVSVLLSWHLWSKLLESGELLSSNRAKHLFWTLLYVKVYSTQRVLCTMVKSCRETYRLHVHHILTIMASWQVVSARRISTMLPFVPVTWVLYPLDFFIAAGSTSTVLSILVVLYLSCAFYGPQRLSYGIGICAVMVAHV